MDKDLVSIIRKFIYSREGMENYVLRSLGYSELEFIPDDVLLNTFIIMKVSAPFGPSNLLLSDEWFMFSRSEVFGDLSSVIILGNKQHNPRFDMSISELFFSKDIESMLRGNYFRNTEKFIDTIISGSCVFVSHIRRGSVTNRCALAMKSLPEEYKKFKKDLPKKRNAIILRKNDKTNKFSVITTKEPRSCVKSIIKICSCCGKYDKLKMCSLCEKSWYCSIKCQKKDWTVHRKKCYLVKSMKKKIVIDK